jgi:hypothetical protein
VELQAVEVSLDIQARKLHQNLVDIRADLITNLAMVDLGAKATTRETLKQQHIMEEVKAIAEGRSRPAVCERAAQPPKFNENTSYSMFRHQFKTAAEHNHWSHQEKSTDMITALKGRATGVLHSIPTNTTYEETPQALEDHFGDQHFAAAYRCQLTTRTQKAGESLRDLATATEQYAQRAYPTLPETHI